MASSTAGSLDRPWSVGRCTALDEHHLRRVVVSSNPRNQKVLYDLHVGHPQDDVDDDDGDIKRR